MVEAQSDLGNLSEVYARLGDPIRLVCSIEAPQPTDFVYWYKNDSPVQFDNLKSRRKVGAVEPNGSFVSRISRDIRGALVEDEALRRPRKRSKWRKGELVASINELRDEEDEVAATAAREDDKNWSPVRSSSSLAIQQASANDTGNYTCLVSSRARSPSR